MLTPPLLRNGKSRLVQKAIERVNFAGDALTATQKFQLCGSFAVILKVFDEMCIQIARNTTMEQKQSICTNLNREFGQNAVRYLAYAIPSVLLFLSPGCTLPSTYESDYDVKFISVCFSLQ